MKKAPLLTIIILWLAVDCHAGIILPDDNFVVGWTTSGRTLRFVGNDLYNYIDGGAELFLEFGFKELLVQGYRQKDKEMVLEVYQMDSPEAALGIYLMKCGEETPIEKIDARNSGNKYQFTIVKGSYFIQVNSFAGDEKLIPIMRELSRQTLRFIPSERPVRLFDLLPKEHLITGSELIIRGPYALQPIFTFGEGDVLKLGGKIFGVVGDYKDPNLGRYKLILIRYASEADAQSAFGHLMAHLDPYLKVLDQSKNAFNFQDFESKFGFVAVKGDMLQIKIGLERKQSLE
ncbi:MAG: hypothetical protein ONB13_09870 [candidate division KSB1 bacterium]|nr:hypothetical protein [candidate division KSB1 bacterium]MDZ7334875.1 hypothetical protein [candidate division KSB1 bacterium]MDZ7357347.1 hypothetical protein [candidate division KSB1 bacterium]MDZ7376914.1 hypothetical protein [candidate division KSB1 bacterium]MDZ7399330.1 hypothetical protein [candidate division KSB1 bacterium]